MNQKHTWVKGNFNGWQAVECSKCYFLVVAVPNHPQIEIGKSYYFPADAAIVWGGKEMTEKLANDLCVKHKAHCE